MCEHLWACLCVGWKADRERVGCLLVCACSCVRVALRVQVASTPAAGGELVEARVANDSMLPPFSVQVRSVRITSAILQRLNVHPCRAHQQVLTCHCQSSQKSTLQEVQMQHLWMDCFVNGHHTSSKMVLTSQLAAFIDAHCQPDSGNFVCKKVLDLWNNPSGTCTGLAATALLDCPSLEPGHMEVPISASGTARFEGDAPLHCPGLTTMCQRNRQRGLLEAGVRHLLCMAGMGLAA